MVRNCFTVLFASFFLCRRHIALIDFEIEWVREALWIPLRWIISTIGSAFPGKFYPEAGLPVIANRVLSLKHKQRLVPASVLCALNAAREVAWAPLRRTLPLDGCLSLGQPVTFSRPGSSSLGLVDFLSFFPALPSTSIPS